MNLHVCDQGTSLTIFNIVAFQVRASICECTNPIESCIMGTITWGHIQNIDGHSMSSGHIVIGPPCQMMSAFVPHSQFGICLYNQLNW